MSGILTGLKAIQERIDADEARSQGSGDYVKAEYFSIKDKQSEDVIFLQELDEDAKGYSEKNGLGFVAIEHSNPNNFKRKAVCTLDDEGRCWACEQHRKDFKAGWKQKPRLYINALRLSDEKVVVISQGLSDSQITPALFEQASIFDTITEKVYRIKRSGAGFNDTNYILTAMNAHEKNVEDYELYDLKKVVRTVPYDQQAAHYLDDFAKGDSDGASSGAGAPPPSNDVPDNADEW